MANTVTLTECTRQRRPSVVSDTDRHRPRQFLHHIVAIPMSPDIAQRHSWRLSRSRFRYRMKPFYMNDENS